MLVSRLGLEHEPKERRITMIGSVVTIENKKWRVVPLVQDCPENEQSQAHYYTRVAPRMTAKAAAKMLTMRNWHPVSVGQLLREMAQVSRWYRSMINEWYNLHLGR